MSMGVCAPKIEELVVDASRNSNPANVLLSTDPILVLYCKITLPISSRAVLSVPKKKRSTVVPTRPALSDRYT